ncbi:hypothetical protein V8G54_007244 [Vigna mungo]|uniref:Protein kinase domain-containing protein n=1 Tax=Vigna mungo TaxID=3915 RepID=A0AAQ3S763_VIGMU
MSFSDNSPTVWSIQYTPTVRSIQYSVVGMASEISQCNGSKKYIAIISEYSLTSLESGMTTSGLLAVKRIKDWGISKQDFQTRMNLIAQAKHPGVLPPVAYYCSQQEKLLAYEYMQNGSLFMLLYVGSESGVMFDWGRRLNVAAKIVSALTYMHEEFVDNGIAHDNLKSNNILFDKNMDPCISEYGLMMAENYDEFVISHNKGIKSKDVIAATFKADVYALGMILLELLTGKVIKNDGFDLVKWVDYVGNASASPSPTLDTNEKVEHLNEFERI